MKRMPTTGSVDAARRRFFDAGTLPHGLVSELILQSWRRCREHGLSVDERLRIEPASGSALGELKERFERLQRLCRPEIESLYADARATGSIVVLTAPDGVILDALGSADFLDKASRVALRPGAPWGETSIGTNAIGTAVVERRAVEVRGGEHYFPPHRMLSCAAAPIFDPTGQLAGVLDLSGEASVHHTHALGMVRFAVEQIEHRLFMHTFGAGTVLRLHAEPGLIGTPREGLLAFEGDRIVGANRHALALTGLSWDELGRRRYADLFTSPLPRGEDVVELRNHLGTSLYARGRVAAPPRSAPASVAAPGPARGATAPAPVFDAEQRHALDTAVRLLDADLPFALIGETGTGKEVFAREIHRRSRRGSGRLVAVNCAAFPEGLIEAELFGYVGGAFTGARREGAAGLLREAHGGVLFLDEIGDMPLTLQSRFLRVLQERAVAPLGGGPAVPVDFSIICATHRDLEAEVAAGRFRADLYFRIAQHVVRLRPVRALDDRAGLIRHLWRALGGEAAGLAIGAEAMAVLCAAPWPGNYRQLAGTLRALCVLAPAPVIGVEHLPAELRRVGAPPPVAADEGLQAIAESAMRRALAECDGNVSAAARRLGVSRSTLYRRLRP
ncbi:sigma-54-dependent Fis family transcriptional regulator [Dokdonella koreensis]|uniref:GAF modulated sigma54 specific transcriptional regulator, Fis family n=1 Tax=Dokdonella koreensis DS-123 TaxID=1300342 RepID=A0A160DSF4_9GAMM|nr:sigma-54-dependent Fis family transcriptional regulator [Dokdonella koreensis]ANB17014.1 GAF modulated sigma54 specific transcriptional regulator, Fis family [Dokdonella koreensis DS-123]